jgi:two-component system, OmpR family, alkaline phosphatase synthesis response regulator PhoP
MLPGLNGLEVLSRLRRESDVYVVLLTARTEEIDKIVGLSVGADDYVTKPFSPRELTARVKAALRRLQAGAGPGGGKGTLAFRQVTIDVAARQVTVDGKPVELTAIEFDLLAALAENRGSVLSREQLLENVWGYDFIGDKRVVDFHLWPLRRDWDSRCLRYATQESLAADQPVSHAIHVNQNSGPILWDRFFYELSYLWISCSRG